MEHQIIPDNIRLLPSQNVIVNFKSEFINVYCTLVTGQICSFCVSPFFVRRVPFRITRETFSPVCVIRVYLCDIIWHIV